MDDDVAPRDLSELAEAVKRADAHAVAVVMIGTAATLDPRVKTHDRTLIGEFAAGILDAGTHFLQEELVTAVKAHYAASEDQVRWAHVLRLARQARQAKLEAEFDPDPGRRERERLDFLDMKEAIESWPCPTCAAPEGWPCMSKLTGNALAFASHPARARLALGPPPPRLQWAGPAAKEPR